MGTHGERPGDFWAELIANILVRIGYFVVTALVVLIALYGGRHRYHQHWNLSENPEYLYGILALSTLAALFGPYLHRKEVEQSRRSLDEVRRDSQLK